MKRFTLGILAAIIFAAAMMAGTVEGQGQSTYQVPKTPWGEPDLQGIYNGNDLQGIPMQRAESLGTRTVLNDDEHRQRVAQRDAQLALAEEEFTLDRAEEFERQFGTVGGAVSPPPHWLERAINVSRIASFVIDPPNGRIPALTPEAQQAQQERQQRAAARRRALNGVEADWTIDRSNYDRCISLGVLNSTTPKIYNSGMRIVQGPGWLAFSNEMIHETRVIPTDGRKNVSGAIVGWMGNSVGRWEGDTLVVETRHVKPESAINGHPLSPEAVLIERFTLADADTLDYRMTVNDPKVYTGPWTLRMPVPRDREYGFYEYACHEGNYSMINILSGSRAEDKRRAEAIARGEKIPEYVEPAGRGGGGGRGGGRGGN
jgi:hypothetical protein